MSENLERKSADFVRSLIKFLCIFHPSPRQIFFFAPAVARTLAKPKSPTGAEPGPWSITTCRLT